MGIPSLEQRVLEELLAIRKSTTGLTVETLGRAHTISQLLGAGDPYIAFTRIGHEILDSDLDISIKAAAASLGLTSEGDTHLKRLDDFGAEAHLDQRQVRRHSDKGIQTLARMISTNWPTETVPEVNVIVRGEPDRWEVHVATSRFMIIEMRELMIEALVGPQQDSPPVSWNRQTSKDQEFCSLNAPLVISDLAQEISLVFVWRGELWPKFMVTWLSAPIGVTSETLGNKLLLRLKGAQPPLPVH